jgi:tRNA dimethylallyltransferase
MWSSGLLEEVQDLLPRGLRSGRTAAAALGYRQAVDQLDGVLTAGEAQEQTAQATRRYARRQESWFRADPRVVWLPADAPDLVDRAARLVGSRPADRMTS